MTAQLSREIVENLLQHNDESDSPDNAEAWEVNALCRLALAGMDSEPVVTQNFRAAMEGIGHIRRTLDETFGGLHGTHCEPDVLVECKAICDAICEAYRRTAPPAPVDVHDGLLDAFDQYARQFTYNNHAAKPEMFPERYPFFEAGYRAAMLKAGPVTAATVPDGWKLVPVEPTMPQELAGHKTLSDTGKMSRLMKTRISNIYRAMLAAPRTPGSA